MDDEVVRNLISANGVMRALSSKDPSDFRSHPLMLPLHEQSPAIMDRTVLKVQLPLELTGDPEHLIEKLMMPLSDLCARHVREFELGQWTYDWYYLELLDRDGAFKPVCWISTELFHQYFADDRQTRWVTPNIFERVGYDRHLSLMDHLGLLGGDVERSEDALIEEWRDWLVKTWTAGEEEWLAGGRLTHYTIAPWSSQLDFDGLHCDWTPQWTNDHEGEVPAWRDRAATDYPGLYWRMIPLYDRRYIWRVWEAMKKELYLTSVFNPAAKPQQDARLWARLKERFPGRFEHMSRRRYAIRMREQRVLEWCREGKNGWEIARLLVSKGLYPMGAEHEEERTGALAGSQNELEEYARRVVGRIKRRLRDEGLIEAGKAGRPRRKG